MKNVRDVESEQSSADFPELDEEFLSTVYPLGIP